MEEIDKKQQDKLAGKGKRSILGTLLLPLAWFFPHRKGRAYFHKIRGVKIGKNVEIGYFCIIGNVHPAEITIEDGAVVTARSTILEHDNALYYTGRGVVKSGPVCIKKGAFLGIGTIVMPGVTIGEKSVIAPYSFVNRDIPSNVLAGGQPAKVIKRYTD